VAKDHGRIALDELLAVGQPLAASPDLLASLAPGKAVDLGRKVGTLLLAANPSLEGKALFPAPGNLGVHRPPERRTVGEVVERLEEIGLSLAVLAHEEDALGLTVELGVLEVAEG